MLIDTLIARQPILDLSQRVRAYELLYRPLSGSERIDDPDRATAHVLAGVFADVDRLDPLRGLPGYVNITHTLLVEGAVTAFPARRVGVEVLEGIPAEPEVLLAMDRLRGLGYSVAVDDFTLDSGRNALISHADIVKVDIQQVTGGELVRTVGLVKKLGASPLAEKVETEEEFRRMVGLGFELFQGYFFARPRLISGRRLDEGKGRLLTLLAQINSAGESIDRIAEAVETHPSLAYQLLRVLDSAAIGLSRPVVSIREAVVLLGIRRVAELASVLALSAYGDRSPEVVSMALTRGRFCEMLAREVGEDPAASFTVGAFSMLDVFTDLPIWEAVKRLPLDPVLLEALVDHRGIQGELLDVAVAYERANWDELGDLGVAASRVSECYLAALDWAGALMDPTRKAA